MLSRETIREHMSWIRSVLVIKPNASNLEIQALLEKKGAAYHLDKNYINRLKNKIRLERAKRMDYMTVNKVLAEFQDEVEELKKRLWTIVQISEGAREKTNALKEIRESSKALFDKMFEAGIFEKNLGKVQVVQKDNLLNSILENLDDKTRKQFIEIAKKNLQSGTRGSSLPK